MADSPVGTPEDQPKKVLKKLDLSLADMAAPAAPAPTPRAAPQASASPGRAPQHIPPPGQVPFSEMPTFSPEETRTQVDLNQRTTSPDGEIPSIIADRYEVERVIGRGGMGVVLLARDNRLGRHVAIKRLSFRSNNMKIVQRRFLREAQTIAGLGHVNIVNVFDIGQDDNVAYITMEYVPGPKLRDDEEETLPRSPVNLDEYIKAKGAFSPEEAEDFMLKLCSAMGYAHRNGTIHRDIKPSNILLTENLEPKVVDFGLARPIEISKTEEITLEGTMLGTPEYSAPEQWGDLKAVGVPADVYALGGVFWFMISGRIPRFFRQSDVLPRLSPIITRAMAQKPGERYQDTVEMAKDLLRAKGGGTVAFPDSTSESTSQLDSKMAPEGSWMCANCNNFSPEKANYCTHCGASGWQTCQLCGSDMKVASQFCPKCGEDVKLAEESVGILLSAKNHANFLEYETAMEEIRDLVKKQNVEATKLSKEWHELVLQRRNLLMEFDSALRVFNLETAVDVAVSLKDMVPAESLSESPDFEVVVKHSELITELRRLLVESATRAHSEYNLAKFTNSIQALNRIFGEDVCGAVNSQLASIHSQLDQALTEAGLALGMNCISRGMDIIGEIPAWKGGDLGDRRTRIYTSCAELLEERDKSIDGIETFIRERRYSDALSMIRQMGRFRLPPDHSEMEPAQADMDAHERIMRIDKVLTKTIDESVSDWIKKDNWEDIQNSLVILEQGESRTWHELLQRLKQATKHELGIRYNKAVEMEQKGRYGAASRAWGDFMHIPKELVPPQYTNQAADFQKRRRLYAIKRARTAVQAATGFCFLLFFLVSSWMTWFPMIKDFVAWDFINDVLPNPLFPPGTQLDHMSGMTPAFIQFGLFAILAAVAGTRLLHVAPNHLDRFSTSPRLILMGFLLAISPVSMAAYEAFYHQVYVPRLVPGIAHPALVLLVVWLLLDWLRGSTLKRVPANFALSLSWLVVVPFVIGAERFGPDVVERLDVLYPSEATLLQPWKWPVLAMTHGGIYLVVVLVEHIIYVKRHGGGVNGGAVTDKTATSLGISTDTSIDFK